jgi:hypothetical protein
MHCTAQCTMLWCTLIVDEPARVSNLVRAHALPAHQSPAATGGREALRERVAAPRAAAQQVRPPPLPPPRGRVRTQALSRLRSNRAVRAAVREALQTIGTRGGFEGVLDSKWLVAQCQARGAALSTAGGRWELTAFGGTADAAPARHDAHRHCRRVLQPLRLAADDRCASAGPLSRASFTRDVLAQSAPVWCTRPSRRARSARARRRRRTP